MLYFFGDSYTFGHGLEDCLLADNLPPLTPSRLGWVHVCASLLGLEYENRSMPGASNQFIFHTLRQVKPTSDDIVVIQFTNAHRDFVINEHNVIEHMGPWRCDERWISYASMTSIMDLERKNMLAIEHMVLWLAHRKVPFICFANNSMPLADHLFVDNETSTWALNGFDKALDGGHPGLATNLAWAHKTADYIQAWMIKGCPSPEKLVIDIE
jgi:hypothetical protein